MIGTKHSNTLTNIVYFKINLRINGTKTSNKINQISIDEKLIIYFVTLQPSKMFVDNINILNAESEKEYIEDSKLLLNDIKNEFIWAWMENQRIVDCRIWIHM